MRIAMPPGQLRRLVESWLAEDVGRGDVTTRAVVPVELVGRARIESRGDAVVAGLVVAGECFTVVSDGAVSWRPAVSDGERVGPGEVLVRLEGPLAAILTAERTALNILGRLSGVATRAAAFAGAIADTPARLVDTRKTTPGLRVLEKYAVAVGGGSNHRFGLDDGILIKDNHIAAAGSVSEAVARARLAAPHGLRVEVEVTDLDELDEALAAGAEIVLLDNMSPGEVRKASARAGGKALLEVSGSVGLDNIRDYALAGADFISVGALTHSASSADVSLEVEA